MLSCLHVRTSYQLVFGIVVTARSPLFWRQSSSKYWDSFVLAIGKIWFRISVMVASTVRLEYELLTSALAQNKNKPRYEV